MAAVAHIVNSLFFAHYKYCYLLTYCYCYKSDKLLSQTSINKTVKLHVPSSAVLEIENVNASLEMGHCQKKVTHDTNSIYSFKKQLKTYFV